MDEQPSQPAGGDHAHAPHDDSEDEDEKKVNADADKIIWEERHRDDYRVIEEELELDFRAERLLIHVWHLMALLGHDRSMMWEQEYRIRDLEEEVKRLRAALRNSIPLADRVDPPLKPRTALEVVYERRAKDAESASPTCCRKLGAPMAMPRPAGASDEAGHAAPRQRLAGRRRQAAVEAQDRARALPREEDSGAGRKDPQSQGEGKVQHHLIGMAG